MLGFRGTVTNKVDAKGRVSVPAKFRAQIEADNLNSIVCYPALRGKVIEAGGRRLMEQIDFMLSQLEPFSEEAEALSHSLIGASVELAFDSEGRVSLPEPLRDVAGITNAVTFVGLGTRFQLWEPNTYANEYANAKKVARDNRSLLRPPPLFPSQQGGGGTGGGAT